MCCSQKMNKRNEKAANIPKNNPQTHSNSSQTPLKLLWNYIQTTLKLKIKSNSTPNKIKLH